MAAIEHRFHHSESQERWRAATSSTSSRQNDRTQFPVKCRRSKRKPRKAITQLAARYVAATTTSFFTNESSSFEQISTRRPKISPARPMATSTMKKANKNSPCVIIPSLSFLIWKLIGATRFRKPLIHQDHIRPKATIFAWNSSFPVSCPLRLVRGNESFRLQFSC